MGQILMTSLQPTIDDESYEEMGTDASDTELDTLKDIMNDGVLDVET